MDSTTDTRRKLLKVLYWRPLSWALMTTYGFVCLVQWYASNFTSATVQSKLRLGDHLPHQSAWLWVSVGLLLLLFIGFEGSFREVGRLRTEGDQLVSANAAIVESYTNAVEPWRRSVFNGETLRLADLVNPGDRPPFLVGKQFTNCTIVGPGFMSVVSHTSISNPKFDAPDFDSIFVSVPKGKRVIGAIGVVDCSFDLCFFTGCGLIGVAEDERLFHSAIVYPPSERLTPAQRAKKPKLDTP